MEISEAELNDYKRLKIISDIAVTLDKIRLFETKYDMEFNNFENDIKNADEDYSKWDDYIEWKAYHQKLSNLRIKLGEIKSASDSSVSA